MATGIKDIARELGVSLATVSRALADSPDISAETKERVWATAEALNYLPNLMARSLRSKRSRVIGVVVQEVASEFGAQAIRGINDELSRCGYQMLLEQRQHQRGAGAGRCRDAAGALGRRPDRRRRPSTTSSTRCRPSSRTPACRSSSSTAGHGAMTTASFVGPDDVFGGYLATEHLIGHGHRRIAHLAGPSQWQASWDRLDGYRRALGDYGLAWTSGCWPGATGRRVRLPCHADPARPARPADRDLRGERRDGGRRHRRRPRARPLAAGRPGAGRLRRPRDVALLAARPDHRHPPHLRSRAERRQHAGRAGDEAAAAARPPSPCADGSSTARRAAGTASTPSPSAPTTRSSAARSGPAPVGIGSPTTPADAPAHA